MDTPEDTVEAGDTPAGGGNAPSQASSGHNVKRRKIDGAERDPTLEEIEAEFWRIVESPDEVRLLAQIWQCRLDSYFW